MDIDTDKLKQKAPKQEKETKEKEEKETLTLTTSSKKAEICVPLSQISEVVRLAQSQKTMTDKEHDEGIISLSQSNTLMQLDEMTEVLDNMKAIVREAKDAKPECKKDVHFMKNVAPHDSLWLHVARRNGKEGLNVTSPSKDIGLRIKDIIAADFLIVGPEDLSSYDVKKCAVVSGITITIAPQLKQPKIIVFHSDNDYYLSDGYSVRECRNLLRTKELHASSTV
eukprot:TRINITY_DN1334_c0_g5_i1.p1 TRINITY_DN1334_c0_g5~~TRINITY_DN1334_c0_g5_i1.p1  ORF type:complete len:225 (+),score=63.53 TRINITY_DN1334_c0_g5_i1:133-807(+)